ncbi:uncharacterized protein LOC107487212 isoform X3 [Arachis duranensis]|uniref:Uncharacterized protein LOC107487212 isoform X3 n=1 Tax=Arachis duranensis TaxID=130453 RepID=A0A6P5NLI3_ARADU|nr:uncharacterized protein LOC107487212 isoform X3 [Arachis duranensis]
MACVASATTSSSYFPFTYDAFLSFRGEDTRSGFTGYLYYSLTNRGIKTFIDDEELGRGKEIASSLFTAIQQSRAAIVVLSKYYASSSFCLDELVKILDCVKGKGRLIIPVFYDVDPSDVRKQTGTYGEALAVHENKFKFERLKRWKIALEKIADLSGYHFKHGDGYEHKFVAKIVGHVSIEIKRATLPIVDHPVGLDSQVENVISLLNVGSSDGVCVLGIHGIGGIDEEKVTSERSEVDVEEEQGSPMAPLEAKHSACKLPDLLHESFTTYLTWFRNVEDLDLSEHNFTVLDESLKELCSLRSLSLNGCRELREIKGIPPNIKYFSARNCISLTYASKNMLLNKELHEDGAKDFVLPSSSIPNWVEHSSNNDSISFWFRNKLPEISLCVLVGPAVDFSCTHICPEFIINSSRGQAEHLESVETSNQLVDHIFITDPKLMKSKVNEVILENEWNHVVCKIKSCGQRGIAIKKLGIYFHKDRSSMENIQFIDPLLHKEELIMGNFQVNMQQQKYMASHERRLSLDLPLGMSFSLNDHVSREPNSSVQGPCVDDLCTLRLGLDYIDLPCHASSERDYGSDSTLLSLASNDTSNDGESNDDLWMYSKELSLRQCWQEPLDSHLRSNLMQLTSTSYNIRDEETAQAVLDHPANILAEYSQSPFLAETQNLQAPLFPSSLSGMAIREEFHHKTCCTVLPTTTDESFGNQVDVSQDDDADDLEMEGFYASLDAETNVISFSPNEETMEALKIALDFITNNNDASVFLDAQHCCIMKTSLDYLSSLSANDGLSGAMRALISEASTVFAHCSSSYIEANMKVESTASELLRADNLKSDLENNKNQFNDTVASEKELRQKLARLEEMKEELEKQIRTTNANIMASRKEQNTTRKRKRDVYVEGKALKAQMDVMKEKVPRLQHEHDLAKENQEKIKAEWSEFGEKFKKIVVKSAVQDYQEEFGFVLKQQVHDKNFNFY